MYRRAGQATYGNMAHAHFTRATNTHRICNTYCFPLQQWLHERAIILRYTYIVCLTIDLNCFTTFIIASAIITVPIVFTLNSFPWLIPLWLPWLPNFTSRKIFLVPREFVSATLLLPVVRSWGTRWRSWLRHCATSRKVVGSILDGFTRIFYWHNPSGHTMVLGMTQPLTEMSTMNISLG
jgi:hypothetical protein